MTPVDLIAELQAARPVAGDVLRERVRVSASAAAPQRHGMLAPLRRLPLRRTVLLAFPAAAVLLLAVAGVGGLFDASGPAVQPATARQSVGAASSESAPALKSGVASPASDAAAPAPTPGRAQRYAAQLTLSVKNVEALSDATQQALRIARDLGGHLVNVNYASADTGISALTLAVPTRSVQEAIVRLSGLGTIVSQQVQIDDLQGQVDELTRQEAVLLERIARLSARIAQPGLDVETRASLEARRDAARSQLAQVRAGLAQVRAEAQEATIRLTLQTEDSSAVPVAQSRWHRTLDRTQEILAVEAEILLAVLVVLGPLAIVAALVWLGGRAVRRRRDDALLGAP